MTFKSNFNYENFVKASTTVLGTYFAGMYLLNPAISLTMNAMFVGSALPLASVIAFPDNKMVKKEKEILEKYVPGTKELFSLFDYGSNYLEKLTQNIGFENKTKHIQYFLGLSMVGLCYAATALLGTSLSTSLYYAINIAAVSYAISIFAKDTIIEQYFSDFINTITDGNFIKQCKDNVNSVSEFIIDKYNEYKVYDRTSEVLNKIYTLSCDIGDKISGFHNSLFYDNFYGNLLGQENQDHFSKISTNFTTDDNDNNSFISHAEAENIGQNIKLNR